MGRLIGTGILSDRTLTGGDCFFLLVQIKPTPFDLSYQAGPSDASGLAAQQKVVGSLKAI